MWQRSGIGVSATVTAAAQQFVTGLSFRALGCEPVFETMYPVGDDVFGHLDPARVRHGLVVAPATANTIAKMAGGIADDMLSSQCLSFPGSIVIAPAMNPALWDAAATRENWAKLRERGHVCIEPGAGEMACGDEGRGRLPKLETIFLEGLRSICPQDLAGRKVMLTLGPTREAWDGVRFWSNPSSGVMGASLAVAAWLRGAEVHTVCGPVSLWLPEGIRRTDVASAQEMYEAASDIWPSMDIGCFTAAVADFRPRPYGSGKFKKEGSADLAVSFDRNPDILLSLSTAKKPGQMTVGFAAETDDLKAAARGKRERKNCDILVGNNVAVAGAGFSSPTNEVFVVDREGREEEWPQLSKTEVAWRIWDWLLHL